MKGRPFLQAGWSAAKEDSQDPVLRREGYGKSEGDCIFL